MGSRRYPVKLFQMLHLMVKSYRAGYPKAPYTEIVRANLDALRPYSEGKDLAPERLAASYAYWVNNRQGGNGGQEGVLPAPAEPARPPAEPARHSDPGRPLGISNAELSKAQYLVLYPDGTYTLHAYESQAVLAVARKGGTPWERVSTEMTFGKVRR